MSHRKFEAPRHGHLGFLPRKKCRRGRGRVKMFQEDTFEGKPHLTGFMAFKVGMSHTLRDVDKIGSKLHQKEKCEAVTYLATPPMTVVGIVCYRDTSLGFQTYKTVFAANLSSAVKRNYVNNWYKSKKKAFSKQAAKLKTDEGKADREQDLKDMVAYGSKIRLLASVLPNHNGGQKKAVLMEIQVNGGSMQDKVDYAKNLLEQTISVHDVFKKDQYIDVVSINKGHGFKGVISRWGVTKLPRKTHKGLRKVACIGAWHPARVSYSVARAGQKGFHHRTEYNKKIFQMGKAHGKGGELQGKTNFDLTEKSVNPVSGFYKYGYLKDEYLMIKGSVVGCRRRPVALRLPLHPKTNRLAREEIKLKFIDTSSKFGKGRFQTLAEKKAFLGPLKKELEEQREAQLKKLAEKRERLKKQEEARIRNLKKKRKEEAERKKKQGETKKEKKEKLSRRERKRRKLKKEQK